MILLPVLITPRVANRMAFSIGGWHPFSGGIVGTITNPLGTINGQNVFSGGLPGLIKNIESITKGVNTSILGENLGGKLNKIVEALDKPVIHLAEWVNDHKEAVMIVAAIVGIGILAYAAYAAWAAEVGAAAVLDAAAADAAYLAAADASAGMLTAGTSGILTTLPTIGLGVAGADAASLAPADAAAGLIPAELGTDAAYLAAADASAGLLPTEGIWAPLAEAGTDAASLAAADASAGLLPGVEPLTPALSTLPTIGTTAATTTATAAAGSGAGILQAAQTAAVKAAAGLVTNAAVNTLTQQRDTGQITQQEYEDALAAAGLQDASIPTWVPWAAGLAGLYLLMRK